MWWNDPAKKNEEPAADRAAAAEAPCRLIATLGDDEELDRSRPVPWDWPEADRFHPVRRAA